ncbi:hypothetical protein COO91_07180 [Nostoc flagelliforme CCNUN1]|uniref:Uncharacterized protein n=1 Tax=Nostoc flagelliforme CCNUN1 TaxID=2038116 RepID=A0A2K8T2A1_9NOSO|nr:hypothetical protein COO91_07180 [Nostoc flagelliforme CCNUN1]
MLPGAFQTQPSIHHVMKNSRRGAKNNFYPKQHLNFTQEF